MYVCMYVCLCMYMCIVCICSVCMYIYICIYIDRYCRLAERRKQLSMTSHFSTEEAVKILYRTIDGYPHFAV